MTRPEAASILHRLQIIAQAQASGELKAACRLSQEEADALKLAVDAFGGPPITKSGMPAGELQPSRKAPNRPIRRGSG